MKPLWASVFMMLAMFLQSSAEKAQRCWVRATIPLGAFGSSSKSHAGAVPGAARPPSLGDAGGAVQLHARGPCVPTSLGTLSQVPCSGVG